MYLHKSKPIVTPSLGLSPTLSESLQLPPPPPPPPRRATPPLRQSGAAQVLGSTRPALRPGPVRHGPSRPISSGGHRAAPSGPPSPPRPLSPSAASVRRGAGTAVRPAQWRGRTAPRCRSTVSFASTWPRAREGDGHQTNRGTCRDGIGDAALRDQCNYTNLNLL